MIYHIITGDHAGKQLADAIGNNQENEQVIVMKDVLSLGPLQKEEGKSFSELRSGFWQNIIINEKHTIKVDDLERLLNIGNELSKNDYDIVWLWVAPLPADVCTYLWTIKYLKKYSTRFYIVNIAGLPFLDEDSKIYFPKSISELSVREINKAKKLARLITSTEIENDAEDWDKLIAENAAIRVHEGGKRVSSKQDNFYDTQLLSFCSHQYQKASKIIGQAMTKYNIPTGDTYLGWRLRQLTEMGKLSLQGDITKNLKDFEVKIPGDDMQLELGI